MSRKRVPFLTVLGLMFFVFNVIVMVTGQPLFAVILMVMGVILMAVGAAASHEELKRDSATDR
jgi:hypothetical protein